MDVFPMPKTITDKMDTAERNFWWNKKQVERGVFTKKMEPYIHS